MSEQIRIPFSPPDITEAEIADGLRRTGEKGPILLGKKPL